MIMHLMRFDDGFFVPFLVFSVPIVAIVGGITAGIIRSLGQQRLMEMAQRERIAAIERGIDPAKLPPLPAGFAGGHGDDLNSMYLTPHEYARRRSQNLLTGGVITLCVGFGVGLFLYVVDRDGSSWGVGIVPAAVGVGLLLSSWLVRPRDNAPPTSAH
jgi:hypothetical protein